MNSRIIDIGHKFLSWEFTYKEGCYLIGCILSSTRLEDSLRASENVTHKQPKPINKTKHNRKEKSR